jgi:hypothetical protein
VELVIVGVPVGMQIAWLSNSSSGKPLDVTRTEPIMNCAVTHGPFPAGGGGMAHPATTYGAESVVVGMPDTSTCGFITVGWACPPCAHMTIAP